MSTWCFKNFFQWLGIIEAYWVLQIIDIQDNIVKLLLCLSWECKDKTLVKYTAAENQFIHKKKSNLHKNFISVEIFFQKSKELFRHLPFWILDTLFWESSDTWVLTVLMLLMWHCFDIVSFGLGLDLASGELLSLPSFYKYT